MLQPPGSSSGRPRPARRGAQKVETPDDVIRQLQKLPANKRCADCGSKLPSCVNLTVGSFVCMACAGIHRELSQRVKGVGHSKFTQEEVDRLKTTDNEKVNLVWLARYNPQRERMKPPTDNTDQNKLKSWIRRKYSDKAWYASADEPNAGRTSQPPPQQQQPRRRQQQQQPTMVQIPPKQSRHAAPSTQQANPVDLFADFSTPEPAPAPQANGGWDAFGGQASAPAPFQADFGNFNQQQQQNQQVAPSQQQQAGFANFNQNRQQQQPPAADPFPADFGSSRLTQQQNNFPTPQPAQQGGFANFNQQQQGAPPVQQQQPPQQGGFANFNQQQQMPQQPGPPPPQQHQALQQGGYANFNQQQMTQQQLQQQGGFPNYIQQQLPQQMAPQAQGTAIPMQQSGQPALGASGVGTQPFPSIPQPKASQNIPQTVVSASEMTPADAISAISVDDPPAPTPAPEGAAPKSAADAISAMNFDSMNIQGSGGTMSTAPQEKPALKPGESRYQKGQRVIYKSASYVGAAEVVKVHFDDELEPFYTIKVNGKEKQTDDGHLAARSSLHDEVESLIHGLSEADLLKAKDFILTLASTIPAQVESHKPESHVASSVSMPSPRMGGMQSPADSGVMSAPQPSGMPSPGSFSGMHQNPSQNQAQLQSRAGPQTLSFGGIQAQNHQSQPQMQASMQQLQPPNPQVGSFGGSQLQVQQASLPQMPQPTQMQPSTGMQMQTQPSPSQMPAKEMNSNGFGVIPSPGISAPQVVPSAMGMPSAPIAQGQQPVQPRSMAAAGMQQNPPSNPVNQQGMHQIQQGGSVQMPAPTATQTVSASGSGFSGIPSPGASAPAGVSAGMGPTAIPPAPLVQGQQQNPPLQAQPPQSPKGNPFDFY